jgi:geranylgeranyl diphosphate synthase type I
MVRRVSEGQQMDMDFENSETVTESNYIEMISGKTAAMFETCAKTGAMLGGANSKIMEICRQWGLEVGLCFQLMDDLIDVTGDTKTLGKPACSDIIDGKRTLIAIHALEESKSGLPNFTKFYSSRNTEVSRDILDVIVIELENSGSIEHARLRAMHHHKNAHALLDQLPLNSHLAVLRELTDWQLNRIA